MSRKAYDIAFRIGGKVDKSFDKAMGKTSGSLSKVMKRVAVVGAAGAAAAAYSLKKAADRAFEFKDQMANVATLLDGDVASKVEKLGSRVKRLSVDTGMATDLLTEGVYQTISAFGDTEEAMEHATVAARAAKAGNAEVADSVSLLAAVTKGYGDTSKEAVQRASDLAFTTIKLGQTTFPELAASMGKVIPLAGTLKVKEEELFGAMATLTGVTGNTAEVSTQLRGTMQGFLQPTTGMTKALKKMGYANGAAALESEGLQEILAKLKKSVGDDEVAFANLFGSIEAKNAVLALTGAQADNFIDKTKAMEGALGATDRAFKEKLNPIDRLKQLGNVAVLELGGKVLPVVERVAEKLMGLYDNGGKVNEFLQKMQPYLEQARERGMRLYEAFKVFGEGLQVFWEKNGETIISIVSKVYNFLNSIGSLSFDVLIGAIEIVGKILSGDWLGVLERIKELISTIIGGVTNIASKGKDLLFGGGKGLLSIAGNMLGIGGKAKTFATGGIASQPSIFGEAGPEMAIPLNRSARSLSLWEKTGRILGAQRSGGDRNVTVHYSPTIHAANKAEVKSALDEDRSEFARFIEDFFDGEGRLAFD